MFNRSRKQSERNFKVFQVHSMKWLVGCPGLVPSTGCAWIISIPQSRSHQLLFQGTQPTSDKPEQVWLSLPVTNVVLGAGRAGKCSLRLSQGKGRAGWEQQWSAASPQGAGSTCNNSSPWEWLSPSGPAEQHFRTVLAWLVTNKQIPVPARWGGLG